MTFKNTILLWVTRQNTPRYLWLLVQRFLRPPRQFENGEGPGDEVGIEVTIASFIITEEITGLIVYFEKIHHNYK